MRNDTLTIAFGTANQDRAFYWKPLSGESTNRFKSYTILENGRVWISCIVCSRADGERGAHKQGSHHYEG